MSWMPEAGSAVGDSFVRGPATLPWFLHFFRDPLGCMRTGYGRFGPTFAFTNPIRLASSRRYAIALGPDANRQILGDPETFRSTGYTLRGPKNSSQRRIRHGLTRMTGEAHRRGRQMLQPTFAQNNVDRYTNEIVSIVDEYLAAWPLHSQVDLAQLVRRLMLGVANHLLFGRADIDQALRLSRRMQKYLHFNFSAGVWLLPVNVPGTPYFKLLRKAQRIERSILELIDHRRASTSKHHDILSMLIDAHDEQNDHMSNEELVGQVTVLFNASYETTANTLTWTLLLLAQHPHVMRRLHDELDQSPDALTPAALAELPWLEAVCKESLRICSAAPYTIRAVRDDVRVGTLDLRRGDLAIVSHYITHHLPHLFPEPEAFTPERWFDLKPDRYEYLPFGAGPRYCLGAPLAMTILKLAVATIVRRFRVQLIPEARVDRAVRMTMGPRYGLPAVVRPQDGTFESVQLSGNIREMVDMPPPEVVHAGPRILKFPEPAQRRLAA